MSRFALISLLLGVGLLLRAASVTAGSGNSGNTVACHYSSGVNVQVQDKTLPNQANGAMNYVTVPLGAPYTVEPFLYERLVTNAEYPGMFPYTALAYESDLHICGLSPCLASFPGPDFTASYVTATSDNGYYSYALESFGGSATYTLYAHETAYASNCSSTLTSVLTLCCLYNELSVTRVNVSGSSELEFYNDNSASVVTRVEHPSRPNGCNNAFGAYVLAASFRVADPAQCQFSQEQSVISPAPF